jgi:putative aldouronate transport system substrate-binding protein
MSFGEGQTDTSKIGSEEKKFKGVFGLMKTGNPGIPQVVEAFNKMTGMELVHADLGGFDEQKLQLLLSTGDIPELLTISKNLYSMYVDAGLFVDLTQMIAKSKYVKNNVPAAYLDMFRSRDGKIYAVPYQKGGGCVGYIRQDWLTKLKLKMPTNYKELVEVLKAFTFNDPDGDGKKDTYGYIGLLNDNANSFNTYNRLILQDASMEISYEKGRWIDGMLQPNFKAAIQRYVDLYKMGVLDPDIITFKGTGQMRSKFFEDQVGVFEYWAGEWAQNIQEYLAKVNPQGIATPMPALKEVTYKDRIPGAWAITTKAKNPQLIFDAFIEGFFDKGPRQILWTYGLENIHWTKKNGQPEFLPAVDDPTRLFKKTVIASELQFNDFFLIKPSERIMKSIKIFDASPLVYERMIPISDTYVKYIGEINALKKEIISKITRGDITVDDGLATYTKQMKDEFKLDQILAELNK